MKIFILKKQNLYLIVSALFIVLFISYIFSLQLPNSFAVEIDKSSFLNAESTITLNDITKSDKKVAYLTFDDGPTTKATAKILDILKEENVKTTFFVVGKHVKENPDLVKRAYDEGHYIRQSWL